MVDVDAEVVNDDGIDDVFHVLVIVGFANMEERVALAFIIEDMADMTEICAEFVGLKVASIERGLPVMEAVAMKDDNTSVLFKRL